MSRTAAENVLAERRVRAIPCPAGGAKGTVQTSAPSAPHPKNWRERGCVRRPSRKETNQATERSVERGTTDGDAKGRHAELTMLTDPRSPVHSGDTTDRTYLQSVSYAQSPVLLPAVPLESSSVVQGLKILRRGFESHVEK